MLTNDERLTGLKSDAHTKEVFLLANSHCNAKEITDEEIGLTMKIWQRHVLKHYNFYFNLYLIISLNNIFFLQNNLLLFV